MTYGAILVYVCNHIDQLALQLNPSSHIVEGRRYNKSEQAQPFHSIRSTKAVKRTTHQITMTGGFRWSCSRGGRRLRNQCRIRVRQRRRQQSSSKQTKPKTIVILEVTKRSSERISDRNISYVAPKRWPGKLVIEWHYREQSWVSTSILLPYRQWPHSSRDNAVCIIGNRIGFLGGQVVFKTVRVVQLLSARCPVVLLWLLVKPSLDTVFRGMERAIR